MEPIKVLLVSGTRADFSKQEDLIKSIATGPKNIKAEIFCTGMHMRPDLGNTHVQFDELVPMGVKVHKRSNSCEEGMAVSFLETGKAFEKILNEDHYDAVILHGDRLEPLACAVMALIKGVKIMHIEGGELSGTIDEVIRHAISKMAHYHLVANDVAKERLIAMGENPGSIYLFGSLDIQIMLNRELPTWEEVSQRYFVKADEFSLVLLHSVVTDPEQTLMFAKLLKRYIELKRDHFFIIIAPNSDDGSNSISSVFSEITSDNFKMIPSMRFDHYLSALKICRVLIGNSSSGIREAPIYGVPVINLGTRQLGRSAELYEGMVNIEAPDEKMLFPRLDAFISQFERFEPKNEFGQYDSIAVFKTAMSDLLLGKIALQKVFFE